MPDQERSGERTPREREADHASLARLSETLVPALVQKLNGSGLGELEVREGEWRIRLRRPPGGATGAPARRAERSRLAPLAERDARIPPRDAAARDGAARDGAARDGTSRDPDGADRSDGAVLGGEPERALATSPTVGVFRPGTGIGTRVRAGDRIAIVDLLGIPQDVLAPIDGTLVDVFVQAGEAVEYGEEIAAVEADPHPERTTVGDA